MASSNQKISTDNLIKAHQESQNISTDDLIKTHQISRPRLPYTAVESAGMGAKQGASLGFADEIEGALGALKASNRLPNEGLVGAYQRIRDEKRKEYALANEDNPASYTGSEIAANAATTLIPGLGAIKGATALSKAVSAAKLGAAAGLGTSTADLTQGDIQGAIDDATKGAALGGALQLGGEGASKVLGPIAKAASERAKDIAESRAVKAVTGQSISALRKISDTTLNSPGDIQKATQQIKRLGRDLLNEEGVITPLSKVEDIAPKVAQARQKYGSLIGEVGNKIDNAVPNAVDAKNIANNIIQYAESIPETLQGQKLKEKLLDEAANFERIGGLSFKDAQAFKNQFKYKPQDADALISNQDATNAIRKIIGNEMDQTAANLAKNGNPEVKDLLNNYGQYKAKYGSFKKASDAATDRVQKNLNNRFVSPSDYGVGGTAALASAFSSGGASIPALLTGAAAAGANKFTRERGSALAARTADGLAKILKTDGFQAYQKAAEPLLKEASKGNPAAILTFEILSQKNQQNSQSFDERK